VTAAARAAVLAAACSLLVGGCAGGRQPALPANADAASPRHPFAAAPLLAAYWESWDDTNPASQFGPLGSVPPAANVVEIADFEIRNGHGHVYEGPYNAKPLAAGAKAIHARGGKILLSIGGYSSRWGVKDADAFAGALANVLAANPGVFDGFDFDDENIPWQDATPQAGQAEIVRLVEAVHARWPAMLLSYTAFAMGADEPVNFRDDQGEDVAVLREIGPILAFVNVMEYTQYANGRVWKPASRPGCRWAPAAADDCYLDVLREFAALPLAGGGHLGAAKVAMGLEVRPEQPRPAALTPAQMEGYAAWLRARGFAGAALWSIGRDRPGVGGHPRGAFTAALARGLGEPALENAENGR
jgi:chitinase